MAVTQSFVANIIGIPHIPSIRTVNVRSGPGTNHGKIFEVPVGTKNLPVLEVAEDHQNTRQGSKVYQWFKLDMPQGKGWVRDDLITVVGDGTAFGYPALNAPVVAFNLQRQKAPASAPATPQAPASPTTPPPPVEEPTPAPPVSERSAAGSGTPMATCMGKGGLSIRDGRNTTTARVLTRMNYKDTAEILDAAWGEENHNPKFAWARLRYKGVEGWGRADYLRLSGNFGQFEELGPEDRYPNPAPESHWSRGWNPEGENRYPFGKHDGWDHAGEVGAPILGGPNGGTVLVSKFCQQCGDAGRSSVNAGFSVGDSRVWGSPAWNFGYGHYIIVRYLNEQLPDSTKKELEKRNLKGAHMFVMYAHLHDMLVQTGQALSPDQQIATMGNSGNSSGPHLHLEVRAHTNANETQWAAMKPNLMTPEVLFLR